MALGRVDKPDLQPAVACREHICEAVVRVCFGVAAVAYICVVDAEVVVRREVEGDGEPRVFGIIFIAVA